MPTKTNLAALPWLSAFESGGRNSNWQSAGMARNVGARVCIRHWADNNAMHSMYEGTEPSHSARLLKGKASDYRAFLPSWITGRGRAANSLQMATYRRTARAAYETKQPMQ